MTVQDEALIGAPLKAGRTVDLYDFRRPTTLAREHSRVLELAFETFARQWGTQLTAKVRVMSEVTSEQVMMHTYDEYAASLPGATAMLLCNMEEVAAKTVIQFSTAAGLSWVGNMLGGNGPQLAPERKFTQVEEVLVRRLIDDALEDLHYSLGSLLATQLKVDTVHYNSQFAQAAATADLMIVATFTIRVGEHTTPATVAIPAEVLLPQMGQANPMASTANAGELMRAQLTRVPVDVSVQITPARVKPSMVLGLAVGDVLPLPHTQHRPLDVVVDGQRLAYAAVGANGARLAGVVVNLDSTEEKTA